MERLLVDLHRIQDYWVFGFCPSSGILENKREHNVSETGSVSSSGKGWETATLLGPVERANLNHWTKVSSF
jgi:hypothetical protein